MEFDELMEKGNQLRKEKKYEEALDAYQAALKADKRRTEAWNMKASTLGLLGKTDEAIVVMRLENMEKAIDALKDSNVKILETEDIENLVNDSRRISNMMAQAQQAAPKPKFCPNCGAPASQGLLWLRRQEPKLPLRRWQELFVSYILYL